MPAPLTPRRRAGPLYTESRFKDLKDPCICFDGETWHIYGSGGDVYPEEWELVHATAPTINGPWAELEPVRLRGVSGPHVAAPSVVYDPEDKLFHMAVQKDFMDTGGDIAYLVSADGHVFTKMRTLVVPRGSSEAGLYDPHFAIIKDRKYLVYSGIPTGLALAPGPMRPQPDAYLAKSTTDRWAGHWKRVKAILRHEDIAWHHNRREHPDYEWGIEGPQILELPDGSVLLNATCFIEEGRFGTRQRVFFALADRPEGPYTSLGPVLSTEGAKQWEDGENGHASAIVHEDELFLFYQARSQADPDARANPWRYGVAVFSLEDIARARRSEEALP